MRPLSTRTFLLMVILQPFLSLSICSSGANPIKGNNSYTNKKNSRSFDVACLIQDHIFDLNKPKTPVAKIWIKINKLIII